MRLHCSFLGSRPISAPRIVISTALLVTLVSGCISKRSMSLGSSKTTVASALDQCLGQPSPFGLKHGAVTIGTTTCVSIFSTRATHVRLMLFKKPTGQMADIEFDQSKSTKKRSENKGGLLVSSFFSKPDSAFIFKLKGSLKELGFQPAYYALRAWGENWPFNPEWRPGTAIGRHEAVSSNGNRFNPNKALLDPFAQEVSHDYLHRNMVNDLSSQSYDVFNSDQRILINEEGDGYTIRHPLDIYRNGLFTSLIDTTKQVPKGVILQAEQYQALSYERPTRPFWQDIIYEAHVKGFTQMHPEDDLHYGSFTIEGLRKEGNLTVADVRGSYLGVAQKASYLRRLGVTTLYLMPVFELNNNTNSNRAEIDDNYFGYWTMNYFSPDRDYAADRSPGGPTREFRHMADELHKHGIKLMLDVVYNHTAEHCYGSQDKASADVPFEADKNEAGRICSAYGPIYSMRGLDNSFYTEAADKIYYTETSGIGPSLDHMTIAGNRLIMQSLNYWHNFMGVDGFRFDVGPHLGSYLKSEQENSYFIAYDRHNTDTAIWKVVGGEGPKVRHRIKGGSGVDHMVEPWGQMTGYHSGEFPPGYSEWNARVRDNLKEMFLHNTADSAPSRVSDTIRGAPSLYDQGHFNDLDRWLSARRGPTASINYVISHDGMNMRDLVTHDMPNDSSSRGDKSNGHQGDLEASFRAIRNLMAGLMVSQGVPMIFAGDEIFHSLRGRHNAYNVDNSDNYLQWDPLSSLKRENTGVQWQNPALFERHTDLISFIQALNWFRRQNPVFGHPIWEQHTDPNIMTFYYLDGNTVREGDTSYWDNSANQYLAVRLNNERYRDEQRPIRSFFVMINWGGDLDGFYLPDPMVGNSEASRWCQVFSTGIGAARAVKGFSQVGFSQWFNPGKVESRSVQVFAEKVGAEDADGSCTGFSVFTLPSETGPLSNQVSPWELTGIQNVLSNSEWEFLGQGRPNNHPYESTSLIDRVMESVMQK